MSDEAAAGGVRRSSRRLPPARQPHAARQPAGGAEPDGGAAAGLGGIRAVPGAEGCDVDHRPLRLAQAFDAFANDEKLLDYQRFVEMVSGRRE